MSAPGTDGDGEEPLPALADLYGRLVGDRVFILAAFIHALADTGRYQATIEHHMGGPTYADLTFGSARYRLTIEDLK